MKRARPPHRGRHLLLPVLFSLAAALALPSTAAAETRQDRASVGGYFRVMARPDLQGGNGRLGFWNLYGRLMNEGPWAALELKMDLLQAPPGEIWTSVHFKMEGGSVLGGDVLNGRLDQFALTQLYARAGNVLLKDVVWQLGTLDSYMGDLGLYDFKPAQIFFGTVGVSGVWRGGPVEVLVGAGDSGFFLEPLAYNPIATLGGTLRLRPSSHFEIGVGGQYNYEPKVERNPFAPYSTPGIEYTDFARDRVFGGDSFVLAAFDRQHEGQLDQFPNLRTPEAEDAQSWKLVGYLGFGGLGPLQWSNLFANFQRVHPEDAYEASFEGRQQTIFIKGLTDDRYQINVGNEMLFSLFPGRLDAVWGVLYGRHWDGDNEGVLATELEREFYSTVLRFQLYLMRAVHLLAETSLAREVSLNGNLWRSEWNSVFGTPDTSVPIEFGDSDTRDTWQLKFGPVLNPTGFGIWSRPSLRLLYGLQWSNVHDAFSTSVVQGLGDIDQFGQATPGTTRNWHHVIALEAEAWF